MDTTEVREEAYAGAAMTAVELKEQCTAIGSRAFANCLKLKEVYAPAALETEITVAGDAFDGCGQVEWIYR